MNIAIVGSSTGIGRSLAEHLLAQGNRVWGFARSDQSGFAAEHPLNFRASRCDVAEWEQVESAAAEVASVWRHLDGLVICAAVHGEVGPTVFLDPARWNAAIQANLGGTFHALRAFYGLLSKAPRRAKVVGFAGGGATKSRPNFSAYAAAKTAVVRLFETVAEELQDQPIDLNVVSPGIINTRLTAEVLTLGPKIAGEADFKAVFKQKDDDSAQLAKALGLVDWLLSPASDGISGRLLSAPWDPWSTLDNRKAELLPSDIYTLRRIVPEDRGCKWPAKV
jgi:NAD(P)-dependent dehydrogenase (short-subunit alcohol dehydrogenase family)